MQKKDVDNIVNILLQEDWIGKTHKDFEKKLGKGYSYDQVERIRMRYMYIKENKIKAINVINSK